jgi:hypothetical protein
MQPYIHNAKYDAEEDKMHILKPYVINSMKFFCLIAITYAALCMFMTLFIHTDILKGFYFGASATALVGAAFVFFYELIERFLNRF